MNETEKTSGQTASPERVRIPSGAKSFYTKEKPAMVSKVDFQRILAPVDFSERSREMLRYAASFARRHGAMLIVLHVVEPMIYPADSGFGGSAISETEDALKKSAETRLEEWCRVEVPSDLPSEQHVRVGQPFHEITEGAREFDADIIVISTHGYTGFKHVLLGSTAERVVRHASCPVLTLHQP